MTTPTTPTSRPLTERQRVVLRAMQELDRGRARPGGWVAQDIGYQADLPRVLRHGSGANGDRSRSGTVAPGFVVASTMRSLEARGLVRSYSSGRKRYVAAYMLTTAGQAVDTNPEEP